MLFNNGFEPIMWLYLYNTWQQDATWQFDLLNNVHTSALIQAISLRKLRVDISQRIKFAANASASPAT